MSILPLEAVTIALDFFSSSYTVKDYIYETVEGEDVKTLNSTRSVEIAIDPNGGKRLENIFGGSVSDGDIGLWTRSMLYFSDLYVEGEVREQSILTYRGTPYFIAEISDWTDQTGARVYRASRYVDQEQGT